MRIYLNKNTFSGNFFTLKGDSSPADEKQFLHGLTILAEQALEVLSHPQEIERAFQCIENVKLIELNAMNSNLQEIHQLFIQSDKISTVVAPKARRIICRGKITLYHCPVFGGHYKLTTLKAPQAIIIKRSYCSSLTTLKAP